MHSVEFSTGAIVFALQAMQASDPATPLYRPAEHARHESPDAKNPVRERRSCGSCAFSSPAWHCTQDVEFELGFCVGTKPLLHEQLIPSDECALEGQAAHPVADDDGATAFSGQAVQEAEPAAGANRPALHGMQLPPTRYAP